MENVLDHAFRGNSAQMAGPGFVKEFKTWTRFNGPEAVRTGDGWRSVSSGNPAVPTWLGGLAFDWFFTAQGENDKLARQIRSYAGIAVFAGQAADKAHWGDVGRCCERFALQAAALGIRTAFVNQPVEVQSLRPQFAAAIGLPGQLEAARIDHPPGAPTVMRFDPRELGGLPAPVQRCFRAVLTQGQLIVAAATVELAGRINLSNSGEQWKPFTSRQRVVTRRPGFLWDARVTMLPGVQVRVVDGYIAGQGPLRAAVLGLFTVGELQGDGEIARGELMRYFAEVPWYPTALLPSQGVRWTRWTSDRRLPPWSTVRSR